MSLLEYARDEYSQNGDDGIIERVFSVISDRPGLCCEFGAWDGIHFSNTRALVERGWRAVMIEADEAKFAELKRNYADNDRVTCVRTLIDDGPHRLDDVLAREGVTDRLDFLSIDIDGLDYYVLRSLEIRPRCIAVEVNAGHPPDREALEPREVAAENVGQPLAAFVAIAREHDYRLVGYNGNAYFVHSDAGDESELPEIGVDEAYDEFLARLPAEARLWLYRVNLGLAPPHHRFRNPRLCREALGLSPATAAAATLRGGIGRVFSHA